MEKIKQDQQALVFIALFLLVATQMLVWKDWNNPIMELIACVLLVLMFRVSWLYDELEDRYYLMNMERWRKW